MSLGVLPAFVLIGSTLLAAWLLANEEPKLDGSGSFIGLRWPWKALVAFALGYGLAFAILYYRAITQPPLRPIMALEFPKFLGCKPPYVETDPRFMSLACVDFHYYIDDPYSIGLPERGKEFWYRIGNDAYLLDVGSRDLILDRRKGLFFQRAPTLGTSEKPRGKLF